MPWNLFKWISSLRQPAPNQSSPKLELGLRGEQQAARHLRRQGYKVLTRRFRTRSGEIDIVCRHGEWLVFVEVKTRRGEERGAPSEAVNLTKQRHASRVALDYLRMLGNPRIKFRFDIVEVLWPTGASQPDEIRVIHNAFDLTEPYIY